MLRTSITLLLGLIFCHPSSGQSLHIWEASSGILPSETLWQTFDTADPEQPELSGGVLKLATSDDAETMLYLLTEPQVDTSGPFVLQFEVRFDSGTSSSPRREPIAVFATTANSVGSIIHIGLDRIFFSTGPTTIGPVSTVDTNETPHVYRFEHDGFGQLTLFQDNVFLQSANAYTSASDHGTLRRIGWGMASGLSNGVSEWGFFNHDALIDELFSDGFEN